jgi:hypothetical protein
MKKIILMFLLLLLAGCSNSSAQTIKPDSSGDQITSGDQLASVDTSLSQDRTVAHDMVFPISDDLSVLSRAQSTGYEYLGDAVASFYMAKGYHEDSLQTLVDNGYFLFWPRNVQTGEPVTITKQQFTDPSFELFGTVSYKKYSKDSAKITRVSYRPAESGDWKLTSRTFPAIGDVRSAGIIGCSVDMASIENTDTRLLLAMFGQLTNYLISSTQSFKTTNNTLPTSFQDLLGPEILVVKENFNNFADLVNTSNVVFKWGVDNKKMSSYVYLNIKGVTYIKHCIDFSQGSSMNAMKTMLTCKYSNLDTSSPILTEKNLASIMILDEFSVSKDNIVTK